MPRTRQTTASLLTFIALILAVQGIQNTIRWQAPYHFDELWRVHSAIDQTWREILYQRLTDVGNPIGDMFLLKLWITFVGHESVAVRVMSTLFTALALACFIRWSLDLSDRLTTIIAVITLGLIPAFIFYGHDAGPYPVLLFATCATTLCFFRWLNTGHHYYMVIYVAVGILGIYNQYFMAPVVMGHFLVLLLGVRWNLKRFAFGFFAFAAVAAALLLGYGIPFLQMFFYNDALGRSIEGYLFYLVKLTSLKSGLDLLQITGILILTPLVFAGGGMAFSTKDARASHKALRQKNLFPFAVFASTSVICILAATQYHLLNAKILLILLPSLCLVCAGVLRQSPRWMTVGYWVSMAMILGAYPMPYREWVVSEVSTTSVVEVISPFVKPNAHFIFEDFGVPPLDINYQIRRKLPYSVDETDILLYYKVDNAIFNYPHLPQQVLRVDETPIPGWVDTFLESTDQIFMIHGFDVTGENERSFNTKLLSQFFLARSFIVGTGSIYQYERVPALDAPLYRFNDAITLENWRLADVNVSACESFEVESWWQTDETLPTNYALSYSLIAADGQTALTDHGSLSNVLSLQWQPDEYYYDPRQLELPCDLPAGEYTLLMVVYDPGTAQPLDVAYPNGDAAPTDIYLTTLHVTAAPAEDTP